MIRRLVVHIFRGIRGGVLDDIGKINLLIGPNNSGKTIVLEALYLVGVCGQRGQVLILDMEPGAETAQALNLYDFLGEEPLARLRARHGLPREGVYRSQEEPADQFAVLEIEGEMPAPDRVLLFDFHAISERFSKQFTHRIKDTVVDWHEKISERMGRVFPEIKGAEVEIDSMPGTAQEETGYIRLPGKARLRIEQFGNGTRHAFKVLGSLIALTEMVTEEQPGLFLWEYPELFMHPAALNRLLQEVLDLVLNKPVQVFMTTQSLDVLAFFAKLVEENDSLAKDIRVYALGLLNGKLQHQKFVGRGLASWFRSFGDPRLSAEEEMASPLYYFLSGDRERDDD